MTARAQPRIEAFITLGLLSGANGRVYAIPAGGTLDPASAGNPSGPFLPGWPPHIGLIAPELLPWIEGVPGSPALADIDGDGQLEVGILGGRRPGLRAPVRRHVGVRERLRWSPDHAPDRRRELRGAQRLDRP